MNDVARNLREPAVDPGLWLLDPEITFLNHGSFGACPRTVLEYQSACRIRMERQPLQFLVREVEALLDQSRGALAQFVGSDPEDLVFVPNATTGVNTILRSLQLSPGDEILVTDQEYNACRNAANYAAERSGAAVRVARLPFPVAGEDELVAALVQAVTPHTRLVLIDHVTSQTGMVLPIERIAQATDRAGVELLVDGSHAPGMVEVNLRELNVPYYTGNCHKWLCAPKGAGFLRVRRDRQNLIRPLTISHGANSRRSNRSRFQLEFGWTGTADPTAYLSVAEALRWMGSLLPGGWPAIRARNRALARAAREVLCAELQIPAPCPPQCLGALAAVPLPPFRQGETPCPPWFEDPLQEWLLQQHRIEVPIISWSDPPQRNLRISAQLYNHLGQYEQLALAVRAGLSRP